MSVENKALCSLDEVKSYLEMDSDTDNQDDLLESFINQITESMENFCGVEQFLAKDYTEYFDGKYSDVLFPNHCPVNTVSGIWNDTAWSWGSSTEVDATTYRIVDSNRIALRLSTFAGTTQNIKITYNAGYATIPGDLKLACIKEVARLYRTKIDKGYTDHTEDHAGTGTSDKTFLTGEWLPETKAVLRRYQMVGSV